MFELEERMHAALSALYPAAEPHLAAQINAIARAQPAQPTSFLREGPLLIAYPSNIQQRSRPGIGVLNLFMRSGLGNRFGGLHVLPPYPSTSDFGFAPMDHTSIDSAHGTWRDMQELSSTVPVVLDFIVNHTSSRHPWFIGFCNGEPEYDDFYIACSPDEVGLGHSRHTQSGVKEIVPTKRVKAVVARYGPDQPDLNYANPAVLLSMCRVLARLATEPIAGIRVDAIAYAWKDGGVVQPHSAAAMALLDVFHFVVRRIRPDVALIPEIDIESHGELYIRSARMKGYSYATAPLIAYAALFGDVQPMAAFFAEAFASDLSSRAIRFLSTHDGLMLRPYAPVLSDAQHEALASAALAAGGLCSYEPRTGRLYELNIPVNALLGGSTTEGDARFLACIFTLFSLPGTPALYLNALLGVPPDRAAVEETGDYRAINRSAVASEQLAEIVCKRSPFIRAVLELAKTRALEPCLSAEAPASVVAARGGLLVLKRSRGSRVLYAAVNFGSMTARLPKECAAQPVLLGECSDQVPPLGFVWLVQEDA